MKDARFVARCEDDLSQSRKHGKGIRVLAMWAVTETKLSEL